MIDELPTISSYSPAATDFPYQGLMNTSAYRMPDCGYNNPPWKQVPPGKSETQKLVEEIENFNKIKPLKKEIVEDMLNQPRIVRIYIVDLDENLTLPDRLIFTSPETFTDATDTELFYDIDIKDLLAKHNEKRVKTLDKEATRDKGKDVFLEPVRVRDLYMTVSNIVVFDKKEK